MKDKKLNICILLFQLHNPNMPVMAITEIYNIYGNYFPSFGHKVAWIVPSRGKKKEIQEESFNKVKIYNIPYFKKDFLCRKAEFVTKIVKAGNCDIFQVRGCCFWGLLVGIYIKIRYNIPFVLHYSFPILGIPGDYTIKIRIRDKVLDFFSAWVMRNADLVFTTSSKWMGRYLIRKGVAESKIIASSNCVDIDLFSPLEDGTEVRERYNLNSTSVVIYQGTLDMLRQLEILLHAFSKVRIRKDNVKLLMVGDGNGRAKLEELASKLKIQNDVIFTGQVSFYDVPNFIAAADICISPVPPLPIYRISSPTKMYEYMAMGKAVIVNEEIPDHKKTIEKSGGGLLVPFDPESFAKAIIKLSENLEEAKEMGRRGREWVIKNANYEMLSRELEKRYYELLDLKNKREK